MLFVDSVTETNTLQSLREAALKWQEAFVAKKVTTSLRVILFCGLVKRLREAVEQVQTDDELKDRLLRVGWLEDGINALLPAYYFRWDTTAQRQVVADRPPLTQDRLLKCLDVLEKGCSLPTVLLRFRSTHKLGQETQADVVPFMLSISLRTSASHECHEALVNPGIQRRLEDAWASAAPRKSAAVPDGQGADRGLSDGPLYGLDPTAGPVDTAAVAADSGCHGEVRPGTHRLQVRLRTSPFASPSHLLPAKLQNPHTVCYFNASAQAFAWMGHLTADLQACCG